MFLGLQLSTAHVLRKQLVSRSPSLLCAPILGFKVEESLFHKDFVVLVPGLPRKDRGNLLQWGHVLKAKSLFKGAFHIHIAPRLFNFSVQLLLEPRALRPSCSSSDSKNSFSNWNLNGQVVIVFEKKRATPEPFDYKSWFSFFARHAHMLFGAQLIQ